MHALLGLHMDVHVSNVRETIVGWHTKRTLSTEHIIFKPSYIFLIFFVWHLEIAFLFLISRTFYKDVNKKWIFFMWKNIDFFFFFIKNSHVFSRFDQWLNFNYCNFKVIVNMNKIKNKSARSFFNFFKNYSKQNLMVNISYSDILLHTHCYSPCRFSDTDLFSIPGRWSLYPRLIEILHIRKQW